MTLPTRPLTATYRLQLNAGFRFADARARVDYFSALGVSHLYLSPILAARHGSMHGYDVVDPTRINPELGTEDDLRALAHALADREMGLIVDIVPNHMAIGDQNTYWDDVLARGERSRFAGWFDVDWAANPDHRKLVLPVLGDELDRVLARGELSVRLRPGVAPRVVYGDQSFPIDPASLPPELQLAQADPEETGELAGLYSGANGRDRLRALLAAQHYRLVFWRRGSTDVNYRRFFDVDQLVGVRVEDPAVFDATHALVLRLVRDGVIDGLRIDHIDGLLDPTDYLVRLRAVVPPDTPIFVEKILSPGEQLPDAWPVQGTTGYGFLNQVESVFLDREGADHIERFYRRLRRLGQTTFHEIARAAKVDVLTSALHADVTRTGRALTPLARLAGKRWSDDEIETALVAVIAALSVYRTYLDSRGPATSADRAVLERAASEATQSGANADIVTFIVQTLLNASTDERRLTFAQRFQQVSGPATAKGVEDTAFYVYVPMSSRDEVGGEPGQPLTAAVAWLHRSNAERARRWPLSLLATNTHDTKRSADVRARLDALSELPHEWERSVRRWRRLNAKHRRVVNGRLAPETNTEYLMYQAVVALWPPPRDSRRSDDLPDRAWRDSARERLTQYAMKAAREAKTSTSWVNPNAGYERALTDFVGAILEPGEDAPFLADVARMVSRVAPIGVWNSLSRIAIHLTSPGTPDLYQGDELWNFTLVDPDNRRNVDFDARIRALNDVPGMAARIESDGISDLFDGRLKLLITHRLLCLRRNNADLFRHGEYEELKVRGSRARHLVAFARHHGSRSIITVASRLTIDMPMADMSTWWRDTHVELPVRNAASAWMSQIIHSDPVVTNGVLHIASTLEKLPVAVLAN